MNKLLSIFALLFLSFLTWHSARSGYAARLIPKVLSVDDVAVVARAAQLTPNDPHAQVLLGALLEATDDRAGAIAHYQTAVSLRPDDYLLRMQLARAQELAGDATAAIASATVAVSRAPFYAPPHWQLGNILVRAGRADEGFAELRLAGKSDPSLLPGIIDLAWTVSGGDNKYVAVVLAPDTPEAYQAFAEFYRKRALPAQAIKWFALGGNECRPARDSYIAELIATKQFSEAYALWRTDHPHDPDVSRLVNPGFEEESNLDEPGFGWRTATPAKLVTLSLDNATPQEGRASLGVVFAGATNSGGEIISQLVLVEPKTHYQLHYYFRTENLVSGGLPFVVALDAKAGTVLQPVAALPPTTNGWRDAAIEFTTGDATTAIQISLRRQTCPSPQCPIFGKLWLDGFKLKDSVLRAS